MLSAFLDGRIVESERRLLEEHLESCAECGARFADMVAAQTALRAAPVRKVSRPLAFALRSLASREAARRRRQVDFRARVQDLRERVSFLGRRPDEAHRFARRWRVGAAAVLLFMAVMTSFQGIISAPQPGDIPTVAGLPRRN